MSKIIMNGWKSSMQKVELTKLQMDLLKLPLKESKENVDSLLIGSTIEIQCEDIEIADDFALRAMEIGGDKILVY
ncbi:hypothetical protein GO495_21600 [Chitinophaga oryziterrae]|uniref:Uncharacterized protein n=1 Tax=Chitinophaga oryziterrae TaxID=1031224 RepID=A0A6N8JD48_9BACT|nr:hypothetical protein [Chitinophaga oryziterrae]MVT43207.1 hypothetical protein [Chitinophaga oryziterrae]